MGSGVKGSTCAGLRVATPRFPGPPNLTALKCLAFSSNSTCPYTHTRGNRLGCLAYMDLSYWGNCWCPVNRLIDICTVPLTLFTLYLKDRLGTPTWRPVFCFSIASKQAPLHCTLFPQIQCHFFTMPFAVGASVTKQDLAVAQAEAPELAKVKWWADPGMRVLYFYAAILCVCSATTGYDG